MNNKAADQAHQLRIMTLVSRYALAGLVVLSASFAYTCTSEEYTERAKLRLKNQQRVQDQTHERCLKLSSEEQKKNYWC